MHQEQEYAAYVGIDWSDKKHDICLRVAGQARAERLVIEHRPEAIQAWAEQLRVRFDGAPVAVSAELQEGPIVWALLEHAAPSSPPSSSAASFLDASTTCPCGLSISRCSRCDITYPWRSPPEFMGILQNGLLARLVSGCTTHPFRRVLFGMHDRDDVDDTRIESCRELRTESAEPVCDGRFGR